MLSQTCLEVAKDESNNTYVQAEQPSLSKVVSLDESYTLDTEHREPQVVFSYKKNLKSVYFFVSFNQLRSGKVL